MDVVTDLTSQSVSYLTVLQDICKNESPIKDTAQIVKFELWDLVSDIPEMPDKCTDKQKETIAEIIWSSYGQVITPGTLPCFFKAATQLLEWLKTHMPVAILNEKGKSTALYTPYQWRVVIRQILYIKPAERMVLSNILHYMPIQIIFCLKGKELEPYSQRLYQVWEAEYYDHLLSEKDIQDNYTWWQVTIGTKSRHMMATELLVNDAMLLKSLNDAHIALPFETLFNQELDEICRSRNKRFNDTPDIESKNKTHEPLKGDKTVDPLERARKMDLHGLAFSGGGIRSATFNLGILQKLAEKGLLPRMDYISTVSGGGYIGTWYASWIKRGGSVIKVADRLNHEKSSDPMGDEVRPIRWLRMFSNYLAPDASIMSADSWTMGITWLRNTLINQVILLLLLCTTLSAINVVYHYWFELEKSADSYDTLHIILWSSVIMLPGALMAGLGMMTYAKQHPPQSIFNWGRSHFLSGALLIWGIISSFFASAWLYHKNYLSYHYISRLQTLVWAGIIGLIAMLIVAYLGYYRSGAERAKDKKNANWTIIISSIVAAAAGLALLAGLWQLLSILKDQHGSFIGKYDGGDLVINGSHRYHFIYNKHEISFYLNYTFYHFWSKLVFTIGPPMVLEIISCCVVIRMALMGRIFPDERREWWGRMGAITHRFSFIWILVAFGALLLPEVFNMMTTDMSSVNIPALFGGWAAIIGSAVKLAYQSKDDGNKSSSTLSQITNLFIRFAPYLFMLGFLLIGAAVLQYINTYSTIIKLHFPYVTVSLSVTVIMGIITLILSMRVGVNEFSLHHFYRNRLVRAYMGATRSRANRDKTENSFTGFDSEDDIKLATFTTADEYYGPFPILNTALNATTITDLDRQDRKAESFVFSPLYCGFDISPTRSAAYAKYQVFEYGYRPTNEYAYENGPKIGTAMAISGAAVNPNMGYHSSSAMAFLLTIFNVRLGWWIGNPRKSSWKSSDPTFGLIYLVDDLVGKSNIDSEFVCLSDGGHFDNMGLYELIRRKCRYIILGDGEEDEESVCEGLANAIRRCRIDFGVEIKIDTTPITQKDARGLCLKQSVKGSIWYPGDTDPSGTLIYIKTALTEDVFTDLTDVREYYLNNKEFPQQSTGDQFFTEEQFESYRKLGYYSVEKSEYL